MGRDWSFAEDMRPGIPINRAQPELTARGRVWTLIVCFNWPAPGYTQMTIRDDGWDLIFDHGRIYPLLLDTEDGA